MVLPHSSTQKHLFTLGGQFAAARGGQYDRILQLMRNPLTKVLYPLILLFKFS